MVAKVAEIAKMGKADKHKHRDTDYLYASSYIRSVEDRGLSRPLISRMLEASDADAAVSALLEARSALEGGGSINDAEELCDAFVNDSFRTVSEIVTDAALFDFLRYQYDCNNIKTALKCHAKGIGTDGLLFSCGAIPESDIAKMASESDYSALPQIFAEAAKTAADNYAKTGDPQSIDLPLDLACLRAMAESADATGEALLSGAVRLRIDTANVMTVLRVLKMKTERGAELLERALSPLGNISKETLIRAYAEGVDAFIGAVKGSLPSGFGEKLSAELSLSVIERMADDAYLEYVYASRGDIFGVSVPFIYLTEREYNAKNARIIIAGKRAGLPYDEIRERVRGL